MQHSGEIRRPTQLSGGMIPKFEEENMRKSIEGIPGMEIIWIIILKYIDSLGYTWIMMMIYSISIYPTWGNPTFIIPGGCVAQSRLVDVTVDVTKKQTQHIIT